jgi:CRP/FNR family cyclic AMP-dependent transcriptional regulator
MNAIAVMPMREDKKMCTTPYGLDIVDNCLACKLRSEQYFCNLPAVALKAFNNITHTSSYPEGALLFTEGQQPRGLYMICKGRAKLSITSRDGRVLIVRIAGPGDVIGLNATVLGKPYEVTAETLHPCAIKFIKRDDLLRFLREYGEACMRAAQHLSQECGTAYDQIRSLGLSHSAPEKLARLLLEWSEDGETTKEGVRVKVALTHEEIAQLIGTSRETVTRILGDFRGRQIATLKGSTLVVRNRQALGNMLTS